MTRICTICARGGSKGLPNKNIMPLHGKPLITWSVEQALETGLFEMVAVSSDSPAILGAAREAGAHLMVERPGHLATDAAAKVPVILHCMEAVEAALGRACEIIVDLDATSPLRLASDIAGTVGLLEEGDAPNVITGCRARHSPYVDMVELDGDGFARLSKTGDPAHCFDMNASIYAWRRSRFVERPAVFYARTRLFEMPYERSIDIDTPVDFAMVSLLLDRRAGA